MLSFRLRFYWGLCLLLPLLLVSVPGVAAESGATACEEIRLYSRLGCPHCQSAKSFLAELQAEYPGLRVTDLDIERNPEALQAFIQVNERRRIRQPGVPTFEFCDQILVGFGSAETTGALIERVISGEQGTVAESLAVPVTLFGELNPSALGLPAFTLMIGLVDGFNPCAMWVLLFLLSLLVYVKDRARVLLVAGTFVLVSGIVYFAFMAAWLNIFMFIGYSRALQFILGSLALLIGIVHVKDFFALGRGFSLSIPASVKPTLYDKARRVVRAESLFAALAGVTMIAVMVNFVELLCTAGLPALYTQVLTFYPLSNLSYYGYLLLYNLAYIADDALMVTIAVITLRHSKLQEQQGRWLKLISGSVICVLGALLVFAPEALMF